jgi:tetratricopeptide (TPR) repeat protein
MGRVYYQLSDFTASRFLERSIEQMRLIGNKVEESTASAFAGYLLAHLGEFGRALAHANHGIQLAQEIQNPFTEANAYHFRGCIFDQRGEWTRAIADYEEAIRIAEKAEDLFRIYMVKSWMGRAHAMIGEPGRGRELLEESSALAEKIGTKFWIAWQKQPMRLALSCLGARNRAQLCQEAIRLAKKQTINTSLPLLIDPLLKSYPAWNLQVLRRLIGLSCRPYESNRKSTQNRSWPEAM